MAHGKAFAEAIAADEENAEARYYAGIVDQRWSRDDSALDHYEKAFERERDNVHELEVVGRKLRKMMPFVNPKEV